MVLKQWLLATFSAVALAIGGSGISAQAAKQQCASEECACEQALEQNTVEALEEFLRKYPQNSESGKTACFALAVPPADADGQSTGDAQAPVQQDSSQYGG